jgi:hypothetical protein
MILSDSVQLSAPSVKRFIAGMESNRLHEGRFVSVFSLMRDGAELAESLRVLREDGRLAEDFGDTVQPYLQLVDSDSGLCDLTGLPLSDIWRYFRHTWANQATSIPGRSMRFLIRDRAAPNHPIIGIGALGSSIIAMRSRDQIIGWDSSTFIARANKMPLSNLLNWAKSSIDRTVEDTHVRDLIDEGLMSKEDIANPSAELVSLLKMKAEEAMRTHHNHVPDRKLKATGSSEAIARDEFWEERAQTPLFRSKRCTQLATVLRARRALQEWERSDSSVESSEMLKASEMRWAFSTLIRIEKGRRVGIAMADLTVCGAVPPYGSLIGGKLVSALAVSPEIINAYGQRYSERPSEIASAMAGRRIVRAPHLVLFGTTSLFGVTSSQYNRLKIPCGDAGGVSGEFIRYEKIGRTETFGTSHFSERTVKALTKLSRQSAGGLRVNSIFGEGTSPKLRKIRDGLDNLGVSSDELLHYTRKRIIYIIPVARNYSEYLLGFDDAPQYLMPMDDPQSATKSIVKWWVQRWALQRAGRDKILDEIGGHDLTYPVRHGARVRTPTTSSLQSSLFD